MQNKFTIVDSGIGFSGGLYKGENFSSVVNKAASKLFNRIRNNSEFKKYKGKKTIMFFMRKIGDHTNRKAYIATERSITPKTIMIAGKSVTYKYAYDVEELKSASDIAKANTECKLNA